VFSKLAKVLIRDTNWLYCPNPSDHPLYYYTYTNTCPRCVLKGEFYFHAAHKPESGTIGAATRRLLILLMQELLRRKGHKVEVRAASEPVDAIFVDYSTTPTMVLFAEVKSAPLLTPSLATRLQQIPIGSDLPHVNLEDHVSLYQSEIYISVPTWHDDLKEWSGTYFSIGTRESLNDTYWAFTGIRKLLISDPKFFQLYIDYWIKSFASYSTRNKSDPVFWFTNGCGQPPSGKKLKYWKQRANTGIESVSDGKSSVGMDRTDDIKKSVYQALKLGVEGKRTNDYNYRVGIISNIHAVRHFDDYFDAIQDVVWTHSDDTKGW